MADIEKVVSDMVRKRLEEEHDSQKWSDSAQRMARERDLVDRFATLTATPGTNLVPGRVVRWKSGMKNRRFPAYGEPAVVVLLLDKAVLDAEQDAGSPYFREPLDLVLGIVNADGDFHCFHFDRRRFESYEVDR